MPIKYIVMSDIHFGHKKTKTADIISRMDALLDKVLVTHKLQIIFIAGDLFDRLISTIEIEHIQVLIWFNGLLRKCSKYGIKLRILEGTPSHDWGQPALLTTIGSIAKLDVDFKYIKYLSIEKMPDLGLNILYVPDEWHPSTLVTYNQVLELLKENSLTKVDIAIMHGQFNYQIPNAVGNVPKHDENSYLKIVSGMIHIGHVHQYSEYVNIVAQGSFDRLCHGDEGKKGFVLVTVDDCMLFSHEFIRNKEAQTYKTLDIKTSSLEDSIDFIEHATKSYRPGSHIRLLANSNHPVFIDIATIERRFIDFCFSKKLKDKNTSSSNSLIDTAIFDIQDFKPICLTEHNLEELLMEEVKATYHLSAEQLTLVNKDLQEVLNES